MLLTLDPALIDDYRIFLRAKVLPRFRCHGHVIEVPDEYAHLLAAGHAKKRVRTKYRPIDGLFDYQRDITDLAIRKRKFATFVEPGYGKTLIETEFARHAAAHLPDDQCVLIIAPPMVVRQTLSEVKLFYGDRLSIDHVPASALESWLLIGTGKIGITNYEALKETTPQGRLGGLVCDESSVFKSAYGAWGEICIRLGKGLEWKLCGTGTPAPNDRVEFANHAVFLDAFPTVNSFLAKYFVNKGKTDGRWELKAHALEAFYRDLSDWCIFVTNPATYGWKDNCGTIPAINVHIHDVDLTDGQREAAYKITGSLFTNNPGGITKRAKLSRIGKGDFDGKKGDTLKNAFITELVESWPTESTIIWCRYNNEQEQMEKLFPDAASIQGKTPLWLREELLAEFQAGKRKVMISKPKVLGFGLNLQVCTRQIFSGLQDSYEEFFQAVKRSNRVGSTKELNVHIPCTEIERPMINTVLAKASRVQKDTAEQERIFKRESFTDDWDGKKMGLPRE